jgi:hypothetical protein
VADLVNKLRIALLIIIIDALLFASLALLVSIDRIVNSTLYNYGLQYDTAWASTYQIYFDATLILIAISIISIILMEVPNLVEKKEKGTTGLLASPKVHLEKDISVKKSEVSGSTPKDSEFPQMTKEKKSTELLDSQKIPLEKEISVKKSKVSVSTQDSKSPPETEEKEVPDFWASQKVPLEKEISVEKNEPSTSTLKDSQLPQATEKKELTGFWAAQRLPGVFCRYCGFENEFDAVFCQKCGKSLVKKNKASESTTDDPLL